MVTSPQTASTDTASRTHFDAVVIGAGFSGLYMLHKLRELGLTARVYEAGDGVGGTWYWNRYPGARCDSESFYYSYSFSEELEQEWKWTERYPGQPEILAYLNHVADRFDLRRDIQLKTRVSEAVFDERAERWAIRTSDGAQVTAHFLITGVGCLPTSAASIPDIKGLNAFKGQWYHTSSWPHDGVDFTGKRVGIIGTGSTGIQAIPVIAEEADHLTVFQRTPNFSVPARNRPMDPEWERHVKENYPSIRRRQRYTNVGFPYTYRDVSALEVSDEERRTQYQAEWDEGGFRMAFGGFKDLVTSQEANDTVSEFLREKIRETVKDPVVAERLVPKGYPFGTKRPPMDTNYFETFNRDDVVLVDIRESPIEEITETGIRTRDGHYELDIIVFATGFDAMTGALDKIDIRGRGGRELKEKWEDGPRAYLGVASHGFPNLFLITGPGSPAVFSNMPMSIEQHVEWISNCIEYMRDQAITHIEAREDAEEDWADHVIEVGNATLLPAANSWYMGANIPGKRRGLMAYAAGIGVYRELCSDIAAKGYKGFDQFRATTSESTPPWRAHKVTTPVGGL